MVRVWEERNTWRFLVRKRDVKITFERTSNSWRDIRASLVAVGLLFMPVQEFYVIEFRWFYKLQTNNKNWSLATLFSVLPAVYLNKVLYFSGGLFPYMFQGSVSIQSFFATRSRRPLNGERDFGSALSIRSDSLGKRSKSQRNARSVLDDTSIY
jgi:hypothetical protein